MRKRAKKKRDASHREKGRKKTWELLARSKAQGNRKGAEKMDRKDETNLGCRRITEESENKGGKKG